MRNVTARTSEVRQDFQSMLLEPVNSEHTWPAPQGRLSAHVTPPKIHRTTYINDSSACILTSHRKLVNAKSTVRDVKIRGLCNLSPPEVEIIRC